MKKTLLLMFSLILGILCHAQEKKLHSVYVNFQGKSNLNFMNPLALGLKLNTKKEGRKLMLGVSGYFPNMNNQSNYGNYNYQYYNYYNTHRDTSTFVSQRLTNGGVGFSIGYTSDFKLFKKLKLTAGATLHNMINLREHSVIQGRTVGPYFTTFNSGRFHEVTSSYESTKLSYIPVLETYFGAIFTMGKHLQLIPRLNTNIALFNGDALYALRSLRTSRELRLTMRPSIMLGYKL